MTVSEIASRVLARWRVKRVSKRPWERIRLDKRCDLGSLAARPGWAKCGLPCGSPAWDSGLPAAPGEGERQDCDRPVPRAILGRHGLAGKRRADVAEKVGYTSEAAFTKAFEGTLERKPGQVRRATPRP
jgi:AraC-like DNA-binding protein